GAGGQLNAPTGDLTIAIQKGAGTIKTVTLPLWGPPAVAPASLEAFVTLLNDALQTAAKTEPLLTGAFAQKMGTMIRVVPGPADPDVNFALSGATATALGLDAAGAPNVARYAPGRGSTLFSQRAGGAGSDGSAPGATDLTGNEAKKSGMYALENVDI